MREALGFLTPLGGARTPTPAALRWFPAVGAAIGLFLGGLWWAAAQLWPPAVAAAVVVVADRGQYVLCSMPFGHAYPPLWGWPSIWSRIRQWLDG
jgi:hypothetical protein